MILICQNGLNDISIINGSHFMSINVKVGVQNDQISLFRMFSSQSDRIGLKLGQKFETINNLVSYGMDFENCDFWQYGGHFSIIFRPKFQE